MTLGFSFRWRASGRAALSCPGLHSPFVNTPSPSLSNFVAPCTVCFPLVSSGVSASIATSVDFPGASCAVGDCHAPHLETITRTSLIRNYCAAVSDMEVCLSHGYPAATVSIVPQPPKYTCLPPKLSARSSVGPPTGGWVCHLSEHTEPNRVGNWGWALTLREDIRIIESLTGWSFPSYCAFHSKSLHCILSRGCRNGVSCQNLIVSITKLSPFL
ncbi:hypothetical protein BJV74DRAFT_852575 [Russula compacta]|nr:hypothetical protein BJV74DRAFT_852575 [Russula compacta]